MAATRNYPMGNVKPWVKANATMLGNRYGLTVVGGYRATGSVANSDHPRGLAADLMCDIPTGQKIVADCLANWKAYNLSYVIHNRKIWSSPTSVKAYVGPSPHTDHVHISYLTSPNGGDGTGGNAVNVGLPNPLDILPDVPNPLDGINEVKETLSGIAGFLRSVVEVIQFLTDPHNWLRIGLAVAGGLLMLLGLLSIVRGQMTLDVGAIRKAIPNAN